MSAALPVSPVPASTLAPDALAALMDSAYSDYHLPMHVDAAAMRFMVSSFDIDLDDSRVVVENGEPVAVALLALRGERAWVGGMGVVPAARRRGLGEALMHAVLERARARGAREAWLEVLTQNVRAIPLYEKLGFRHVRRLDVVRLAAAPAVPPGIATRAVTMDEAMAYVGLHRRSEEPWQREEGSLRRWIRDGLAMECTGAFDGERAIGVAVHRIAAGRASILQMTSAPGREEQATLALLAAAFRPEADQGLRWLNLPQDDPASRIVLALPHELEASQHDMRLAL